MLFVYNTYTVHIYKYTSINNMYKQTKRNYLYKCSIQIVMYTGGPDDTCGGTEPLSH